jgi:hypothetical protein
MQSSDSSSPSAAAPVLPRERPTTWWTLLLRPVAGAPNPRRVGGWFPGLRHTGSPGGGSRPPRFLGRPLARVPRFLTPPSAPRLAHNWTWRCCLQGMVPSRLGDGRFRGQLTRPTCSRAYASPDPLPNPAQGSLPACRAQLWPDGFRTRWTTNRISEVPLSSSLLTSLAWSHTILCFWGPEVVRLTPLHKASYMA